MSKKQPVSRRDRLIWVLWNLPLVGGLNYLAYEFDALASRFGSVAVTAVAVAAGLLLSRNLSEMIERMKGTDS